MFPKEFEPIDPQSFLRYFVCMAQKRRHKAANIDELIISLFNYKNRLMEKNDPKFNYLLNIDFEQKGLDVVSSCAITEGLTILGALGILSWTNHDIYFEAKEENISYSLNEMKSSNLYGFFEEMMKFLEKNNQKLFK